jgi:hypothetical protein
LFGRKEEFEYMLFSSIEYLGDFSSELFEFLSLSATLSATKLLNKANTFKVIMPNVHTQAKSKAEQTYTLTLGGARSQT